MGQTEPVLSNCILAEAERRHIEMVLTKTNGRFGGKQGAATLLGIPRTTLQSRLKSMESIIIALDLNTGLVVRIRI